MIDYTLAELRRLLINLITRAPHPAEHVWTWSWWRRRHQYHSQQAHYQRRRLKDNEVLLEY